MKALSKHVRILSAFCVLFFAVVLFTPNVAEAASVTISQGVPKSQTVAYSGETISVTLSGAYTSVALQGKPSWISCTKSGSKFTLTVSRNTSTSSRRSDVVFRDGTKLWTLRVTQNGAPTVKVTLDPNGGTVSPTYVYVPVGGSYGSLPNPTKTGYTFQGWYTAKSGGTRVNGSTKVTNPKPHTLYAHWNAKPITVTFNANGGTCSTKNKTVTYGNTYGTLPTASRKGYSFQGWFTAASGGTKITSSSKVNRANNHTLYAQWKAVPITVTFKDGSTTVATKKVTYGSTYGTLPTRTKIGHTFNGWYTASSGGTKITASTKVTVTSNQTLYAQWTKKPLKVLVLNFDPTITMKDGTKVKQHELMEKLDVKEKAFPKWNDPAVLAKQFAAAMEAVSYGSVSYTIAKTIVVDELPMDKTGKQYTPSEYYNLMVKACNEKHGRYWEYSGWRDSGFNFDYDKYFKKYDVYNKVNNGTYDEVWIFAGPCSGTTLYESMMTGKDAFWLNGAEMVKSGQRNFATYGFNYERDLDCMLEDAGHRFERTMDQVYFGKGYHPITEANYAGKTYAQLNDWEKFYANDLLTGGKIIAGVGNVHCGPNARFDYDWDNPTKVKSYCEDWLNYPNLKGTTTMVNGSAWGNTQEGHHRWWFKHIPHADGKNSKGIYNNWWYYFRFDNLN